MASRRCFRMARTRVVGAILVGSIDESSSLSLSCGEGIEEDAIGSGAKWACLGLEAARGL